MCKMFCRLLSALVVILSVSPFGAEAQTLSGRIMLNDSVPAAFATVFVSTTGQGTIADNEGNYMLEALPSGDHEVEFSYIGFRTEQQSVGISGTEDEVLDVMLNEQPLNLSEVFVTPTGEDPAVYILRKVSEQAAINRKRLKAYDASVVHAFHAQDVDFVPAILPSAFEWVIKATMKTMRMGEIYELCTRNERVDVRMSVTNHFASGKTKYLDEHVVSSSPALTAKAEQQLFRICQSDLFDQLYGKDMLYFRDLKKGGKGEFAYKLKGTIEEQGRTIDVLEHISKRDSLTITSTVYVVEDNWGILRSELHFMDGSLFRTECRDIGGGIFMPVIEVSDPHVVTIDAGMIQEEKEKMEASGEKMGRMERKMFERMERILATRGSLQPCMTFGYNIQYRNVVIE